MDNRKTIVIIGLTVGTIFAAFGFGITVGAWLSGHRPDAWIIALTLVLSILLGAALIATCVKSST